LEIRGVKIHWGLLLLAACSTAEPIVPPPPGNADAAVVVLHEDAAAAPDAAARFDDAAAPADDAAMPPLTVLQPEAQRAGDPLLGYAALLDRGYVGCGVPDSAYRLAMGSAPMNVRLPGRNALNADLPYSQTRYVTSSTVTVVSANCLTCHGSMLDGRVVVGLGNASADFTGDQGQTADLVGLVLSRPDEIREWQKWSERVKTISPYIQMPIIGVNPADNLANALFAHRDPTTLSWSTTPLMEMPPTTVLPVDVPAWWLGKHKSSMFWVGSGRGDHARIMMTASTLCVDTVAEAEAIDAYFPDVRAFLMSLEPPAFPMPTDPVVAERGRMVFTANCSRCHGTYGAGRTYPNFLVSTDEVGTDALLAVGSSVYAARFVDWFNRSWYGGNARLEPKQGYIAPPLDGIWATAPYLHNGSVPTLAALLESSTRPAYWRRTYGTAMSDYDSAAVGWKHTVVDHGHADEPNASLRRTLYDTTLLGYGNAGHTFGDPLTSEERLAVIEYLKTL